MKKKVVFRRYPQCKIAIINVTKVGTFRLLCDKSLKEFHSARLTIDRLHKWVNTSVNCSSVTENKSPVMKSSKVL